LAALGVIAEIIENTETVVWCKEDLAEFEREKNQINLHGRMDGNK